MAPEQILDFNRRYATELLFCHVPGVKTPGYPQMPLRGITLPDSHNLMAVMLSAGTRILK